MQAGNDITIRFSLNGQDIAAAAEETILEAAERHGVEIPRLCYKEGYRSDGNCRACMVEIEGERALAPSCCRRPSDGMKVSSDNERALHSQKMVLELLLADMPKQGVSRLPAGFGTGPLGLQAERVLSPLRSAYTGRAGPLAPRHRGQPGCLYPVHPLRARLPGRAGQRRYRLRTARQAFRNRVRHGRPDGREHLRGLRRVRAGLPHRRADAGPQRRAGGTGQTGGFGLPRTAAWAAC